MHPRKMAYSMELECDSPQPVIVSTNRFLDIAPYVLRLCQSDPGRWMSIFPWEFPQDGSREQEEQFLRQVFPDSEIHMQGGVQGAGLGFKFLKQVWYTIALWNLQHRLPNVEREWFVANEDVLSDPSMRGYICDASATLTTFFTQDFMNTYDDRFLTVVMRDIQYKVRNEMRKLPAALPASSDIAPEPSVTALTPSFTATLPSEVMPTPADIVPTPADSVPTLLDRDSAFKGASRSDVGPRRKPFEEWKTHNDEIVQPASQTTMPVSVVSAPVRPPSKPYSPCPDVTDCDNTVANHRESQMEIDYRKYLNSNAAKKGYPFQHRGAKPVYFPDRNHQQYRNFASPSPNHNHVQPHPMHQQMRYQSGPPQEFMPPVMNQQQYQHGPPPGMPIHSMHPQQPYGMHGQQHFGPLPERMPSILWSTQPPADSFYAGAGDGLRNERHDRTFSNDARNRGNDQRQISHGSNNARTYAAGYRAMPQDQNVPLHDQGRKESYGAKSRGSISNGRGKGGRGRNPSFSNQRDDFTPGVPMPRSRAISNSDFDNVRNVAFVRNDRRAGSINQSNWRSGTDRPQQQVENEPPGLRSYHDRKPSSSSHHTYQPDLLGRERMYSEDDLNRYTIGKAVTHVTKLIMFGVPNVLSDETIQARVSGYINQNVHVSSNKTRDPAHARHEVWLSFESADAARRVLGMDDSMDLLAPWGIRAQIQVPREFWDPTHTKYPGCGEYSRANDQVVKTEYGAAQLGAPVFPPETGFGASLPPLKMGDFVQAQSASKESTPTTTRALADVLPTDSGDTTPTPSRQNSPKKNRPKKSKLHSSGHHDLPAKPSYVAVAADKVEGVASSSVDKRIETPAMNMPEKSDIAEQTQTSESDLEKPSEHDGERLFRAIKKEEAETAAAQSDVVSAAAAESESCEDKAIDISDGAAQAVLNEEHVDDSFHTATGSPSDKNNSTIDLVPTVSTTTEHPPTDIEIADASTSSQHVPASLAPVNNDDNTVIPSAQSPKLFASLDVTKTDLDTGHVPEPSPKQSASPFLISAETETAKSPAPSPSPRTSPSPAPETMQPNAQPEVSPEIVKKAPVQLKLKTDMPAKQVGASLDANKSAQRSTSLTIPIPHTPGFVTAPSTPAVGAGHSSATGTPEQVDEATSPILAKKPAKVKGPAVVESLSVFGKKKKTAEPTKEGTNTLTQKEKKRAREALRKAKNDDVKAEETTVKAQDEQVKQPKAEKGGEKTSQEKRSAQAARMKKERLEAKVFDRQKLGISNTPAQVGAHSSQLKNRMANTSQLPAPPAQMIDPTNSSQAAAMLDDGSEWFKPGSAANPILSEGIIKTATGFKLAWPCGPDGWIERLPEVRSPKLPPLTRPHKPLSMFYPKASAEILTEDSTKTSTGPLTDAPTTASAEAPTLGSRFSNYLGDSPSRSGDRLDLADPATTAEISADIKAEEAYRSIAGDPADYLYGYPSGRGFAGEDFPLFHARPGPRLPPGPGVRKSTGFGDHGHGVDPEADYVEGEAAAAKRKEKNARQREKKKLAKATATNGGVAPDPPVYQTPSGLIFGANVAGPKYPFGLREPSKSRGLGIYPDGTPVPRESSESTSPPEHTPTSTDKGTPTKAGISTAAKKFLEQAGKSDQLVKIPDTPRLKPMVGNRPTVKTAAKASKSAASDTTISPSPEKAQKKAQQKALVLDAGSGAAGESLDDKLDRQITRTGPGRIEPYLFLYVDRSEREEGASKEIGKRRAAKDPMLGLLGDALRRRREEGAAGNENAKPKAEVQGSGKEQARVVELESKDECEEQRTDEAM